MAAALLNPVSESDDKTKGIEVPGARVVAMSVANAASGVTRILFLLA